MKVEDMAARFEALGNPTRLQIVRILVRAGEDGLPVGHLRDRLAIAGSTLSHHLAKLIAIGIVTQERRATTLICRCDFKAMRQTAAFLIEECCADAHAAGSKAQLQA